MNINSILRTLLIISIYFSSCSSQPVTLDLNNERNHGNSIDWLNFNVSFTKEVDSLIQVINIHKVQIDSIFTLYSEREVKENCEETIDGVNFILGFDSKIKYNFSNSEGKFIIMIHNYLDKKSHLDIQLLNMFDLKSKTSWTFNGFILPVPNKEFSNCYTIRSLDGPGDEIKRYLRSIDKLNKNYASIYSFNIDFLNQDNVYVEYVDVKTNEFMVGNFIFQEEFNIFSDLEFTKKMNQIKSTIKLSSKISMSEVNRKCFAWVTEHDGDWKMKRR